MHFRSRHPEAARGAWTSPPARRTTGRSVLVDVIVDVIVDVVVAVVGDVNGDGPYETNDRVSRGSPSLTSRRRRSCDRARPQRSSNAISANAPPTRWKLVTFRRRRSTPSADTGTSTQLGLSENGISPRCSKTFCPLES